MIEEFSDIFPEDLPNKLQPVCDIQQAIDLGADQVCQTYHITE